jgi:uncharacterized protein YjbI with pentapeptide repeats
MEKKQRTQVSVLSDLQLDYFDNNQSIETTDFRQVTFDAVRFRASKLRSCTFTSCTFIGCIFDDMDFQRVDFCACDFSHCTFNHSFRYITGSIENCLIDTCDFSYALIQNTRWPGTTFKNVDFHFVKMKSVDYRDSHFEGVDFDGANIVRGIFTSVPGLERRMFYNTKLDDCTFDWLEAFIVMEFGNPQTDNLYTYGIEPVLRELNVEPKRVDRYEFHGRITDEILQNLITCKFVVAECSAPNKNVFFEIGFALGHKKPIVFCVDKADNIPFDLKDYRFIIHNHSIATLRQQLKERAAFIMHPSENQQ